MHPSINQFSSTNFYDGQILNGVSAEDRLLPPSLADTFDEENRCLFVNCSGLETRMHGKENSSIRNDHEVKVVIDYCHRLMGADVLQASIAIITPYAEQKNRLMSQLARERMGRIEIGTVDAFQGREFDFVIISLVRSNKRKDIGFLKSMNRMNVSITRARIG